MLSIDPQSIATKDLHQFMVGAVAPRPIAWVSTIDEDGQPNLAPYSFFNAFSSNPPIVVFSSNRRVSNNTTKDTLHNIEKTGEAVINMVSYDLVQQMAITSVEFPSNVNEFEKAGLEMMPSDVVKPMRVKGAPVHMECRIDKIIPLGDKGGAGHLIICNVVRLHIATEAIDERQRIDPFKLDLVGRLGRAYYSRITKDSVFTLGRSQTDIVIGYDVLPENIKKSIVLTGNDLGLLAGLYEIPSREHVLLLPERDTQFKELLSQKNTNLIHAYAKKIIDNEQVTLAAEVLFYEAWF